MNEIGQHLEYNLSFLTCCGQAEQAVTTEVHYAVCLWLPYIAGTLERKCSNKQKAQSCGSAELIRVEYGFQSPGSYTSPKSQQMCVIPSTYSSYNALLRPGDYFSSPENMIVP